jgi:hypothetical protein
MDVKLLCGRKQHGMCVTFSVRTVSVSLGKLSYMCIPIDDLAAPKLFGIK